VGGADAVAGGPLGVLLGVAGADGEGVSAGVGDPVAVAAVEGLGLAVATAVAAGVGLGVAGAAPPQAATNIASRPNGMARLKPNRCIPHSLVFPLLARLG
jgi:hypothetical protein